MMNDFSQNELLAEFLSLPNSHGSKIDPLLISENIGRHHDIPLIKSTAINKGNEIRPFHASYVNFQGVKRKYIAAETPLDKNHAGEFLKALRSEKCEHLIWLISLEEAFRLSVYPQSLGERILNYTCTKIFDRDKRRSIVLTSDDQQHQITLHIIEKWEDQKAPDLLLLQKFREGIEKELNNSHGPLAVSCKAGIGRTGTYIALDAAINGSKKLHEIKGLVTHLRKMRLGAVETLEQYQFIYQFLSMHRN